MKPIILLWLLGCGINGYAQQFPTDGPDSIKLARVIAAIDYHQDTLKTVFTFNWQKANQENAYYFTEAFPVTDHWCALDYYIQSKTLASKGFFKDRELQVKDGPFIDFYPDGSKARYGSYKEGKKTGWWLRFSEKGRITDSVFYILGVTAGRAVSWYPTGEVAAVAQRDSFGSGTDTGYFKSGSVSYSGTYFHGHGKDGLWRHFAPDGRLVYEALFDKGDLTSEKCFDPMGKEQENCIREKMPEFPGGQKKLNRYLSSHIRFPHYKASGQILVQFTVDTSGSIGDIKLVQSLPPAYGDKVVAAYNDAVISAIRKMPVWEPGIGYNQKVKVYYTLPVTFRLE